MSRSPGISETVLVSLVLGGIASCLFYVYHAPGALELSLSSKYGVTSSEIGVMFTIYSAPNCFMPLVAGLLIDAVGRNVLGFWLLVLIMSGSALFARAPLLVSSHSAIVGMFYGSRLLLGFGGESIITLVQAASTHWFG